MRARGLAAAVALTAALAAGCGDDRLSADELRSQAGSICASEKEATAKIPAPTEAGGIEAFLARGTGAVAPRLRDLERLRPPRELEAAYREAVGLVRREQELAMVALRSVRGTGDPVAELQRLARDTAPLTARENALWRQLQIKRCVDR